MTMARSKDKTNNRASVNAVSLIVTFCVLLVAITVSDGSFANSIEKISQNLDVALEDLKDDMPNYTDYRENDRAFAKISFNPKGMAGLYNLTIKIMDWILDEDVVVKDLLNMHDPKNPQFNSKVNAADLLRFYWPILVLVLVLALIAVLLPFCGFCVCCCRCCCGNCGGRARPCDKRRDLCRKVMLGTVLIVLGTALLFCVVCAFASNEQLSGGIEELPDNIKIGRNTFSIYLDSTDKQLDHLLITNFNEFSDQFLETLGKSGDYIMQDLNQVSHALALINLKTFVDSLPLIKKSTEKLKTSTNSLRVYASQLNDAMRKVKRDLLVTLHKCQAVKVKACEDLLNKINNLKTNIDFDKLPDITPLMNNLDELPNDQLNKAVTEGKNKLDTIENNIKHHLEDALHNVRRRIMETNTTIQEDLARVKDVLGQVKTQVLNKTDPHIKDLRSYIKQYNRYIYYVGFSMGMILLLVAVGITFGLVCGICGKRPDGYNDNCCNKGVGSQFLMCSVAVMFLFGFFIAIVAFAYLMLGVTTNRGMCYPLRHPDRSTLLAYVDKYIEGNMKSREFDINITHVLEHCYYNRSIYNVLNLKDKFDIDELSKKANISKYLDDMQNSVSDIIPKNFKILSGPNKKVLKDLGERELSINFEQFENELNANFTNLNLKDISKQLGEITVPNEEITKEVKLSILHIDTYDEKLLTPMNDISQEMIQTAHELYDHLRMGAKDFQTAVKNLTASITEAEETLNRDGPNLIKKVITDFGNVIQNQVKSYVNRVSYIAKNELGQCGVLSLAINQTLTATCDKIVMPMNGFWVTLVLSLILFIPTIIVAMKLANLYQRYKPNGHYVETEYLYDAYADRDNIPLNSRSGHKRGKKKPKKGKKYEERPPNMGGEVVTREYAAGSHPPDSRYGDMAPKHWEDFPNGGPPQYQRAPTEYERPPPYYYPATGDQ